MHARKVALDLAVDDGPAMFRLFETLLPLWQGGIGIGPKGQMHIHIDWRHSIGIPGPVAWIETKNPYVTGSEILRGQTGWNEALQAARKLYGAR
jgi:hypothetical protein